MSLKTVTQVSGLGPPGKKEISSSLCPLTVRNQSNNDRSHIHYSISMPDKKQTNKTTTAAPKSNVYVVSHLLLILSNGLYSSNASSLSCRWAVSCELEYTSFDPAFSCLALFLFRSLLSTQANLGHSPSN